MPSCQLLTPLLTSYHGTKYEVAHVACSPRKPDMMQSNLHNRKLGRVNGGYARNAPGERHAVPNSPQCVSWGGHLCSMLYKVCPSGWVAAVVCIVGMGSSSGRDNERLRSAAVSRHVLRKGTAWQGCRPAVSLLLGLALQRVKKRNSRAMYLEKRGLDRIPHGTQEPTKASTARESAETGCTESGQSGIPHGGSWHPPYSMGNNGGC